MHLSQTFSSQRTPPEPFGSDEDATHEGVESDESIPTVNRGNISRGFWTGIITTTIGTSDDVLRAAAISTDGLEVYAAGRSFHATTKNDFLVARLFSDGSFNTTYSGDGWTTTDFGNNRDEVAHTAAWQTDGKLLVGGRAHNGTEFDFALARYLTNGVLDTSFNGTGFNTHTITAAGFLRGVFFQTDGEIAATGYANVSGYYEFATVRYTANGVLDTTWGTNGAVTTAINSNKDNCATAVSVMSSGKVYVVGGTYPATWDVGIARFMTNGVLDTTFATSGKISTTVANGDDILWAMAQNSDEKLVGAGESYNGSNQDFLLMRYMTTGVLDTTFSSDGVVVQTISSSHDIARAIGIDGDGKIIVGGSAIVSSSADFAMARFHTDGSQDTGWMNLGALTQTFGTGEDTAIGGAINTNGTFYAVGRASNGANYDFALNITRTAMWIQQAYLKPTSVTNGDAFGMNLAIDGDTAVVGATGEDSQTTVILPGADAATDDNLSASGAAYVFIRNGTAWEQQAYLKPFNTGSGDSFSNAVAVSGNRIAIGARSEDSNSTAIINGSTASTDDSATNAGAVYVFARSGTIWQPEAYIKAVNNSGSDSFGDAVALDGNTLVISASSEDSAQTSISNDDTAPTDDGLSNSGAAYVYAYTASGWVQQAYLKAPDSDTGDGFGTEVAISGDTIAVSAPFEDSASTDIFNGIGGSTDDTSGNAGAVYVFVRSGSDWTQQAYIKASNNGSLDNFGFRLAMDEDTLVVGVQAEDGGLSGVYNGPTASTDDGGTSSGAVYVFVRSGTEWAQQAYIKSGFNRNLGSFGCSVDIEGDRLVVGEWGNDSGTTGVLNGTAAHTNIGAADSGAAFVFARNGSLWHQEAQIKPTVVASSDNFGDQTIGISGRTIIAGGNRVKNSSTGIINGTASGTEIHPTNSYGAAYIFGIQ